MDATKGSTNSSGKRKNILYSVNPPTRESAKEKSRVEGRPASERKMSDAPNNATLNAKFHNKSSSAVEQPASRERVSAAPRRVNIEDKQEASEKKMSNVLNKATLKSKALNGYFRDVAQPASRERVSAGPRCKNNEANPATVMSIVDGRPTSVKKMRDAPEQTTHALETLKKYSNDVGQPASRKKVRAVPRNANREENTDPIMRCGNELGDVGHPISVKKTGGDPARDEPSRSQAPLA